jgi:hypothetical protein
MLTAGESESSLDSHEVLIIFNQYVDEPGVLQTQIKSNSCTFFLNLKNVMKKTNRFNVIYETKNRRKMSNIIRNFSVGVVSVFRGQYSKECSDDALPIPFLRNAVM